MEDEPIVISLPSEWKSPEGTLEPLLDHPDPKWYHIMNFVCEALQEASNDESVLLSYRDQAMAHDFSHLVRVSMCFMGEMELVHDIDVLI